MTPGELREYCKVMKEFGMSRVVMGDTVLTLGADLSTAQTLPNAVPSKAGFEDIPHPFEPALADLPEGVPLEPSEPIKHKVEALTSLLKLSDTDLVDQLFPETQQIEEEESA